ncbi:MAG: AAA family ATPase [bacterium]|nr:AAA family ATPase [bacterium]
MICSVEALRYRCLRDVRQDIAPFQILVGPNASGKSTFLDVPLLLGDLLKKGLPEAIRERSPNLSNLVWMEEAERFELAVELDIPEAQRARIRSGHERVRYEVAIGHDVRGELSILAETLWLKPRDVVSSPAGPSFPAPREARASVLFPQGGRTDAEWKKVVTKETNSGNDYFFSETTDWNNPFRLGPRKLALANLPEDEERFPVATWIKRALMEGIERLALNSEAMRRPAPPGSPTDFQPDGSNLPWAVEALRSADPERFERWIAHVRTALPDVRTVETIEREEDRHRYLRILYETGHRAPSWTVSDGTLRLLTLTLVAYLDPPGRVFLIEEPENGIHPQAVECVFQALSSVYDCQVLCASHSPVILSLVEPEQLLCFARTPEGVTDVVRGDEHPLLREWKREADLGMLFASGVLG